MNTNKSIAEQTVVIILSAGKGTRMGRDDLAKVCFEIDGIPAINRIINTFKKQRFSNFMLVVGSKAEQVMQTVTDQHPDVSYVFQNPQLGTGHAAKIAAEVLQNLDFQGNVIITMGDKLIDESAIETVLAEFIKQHADAIITTIPKTKETQGYGGRVMLDHQARPLTIIEKADLKKQAIIDELRTKLQKNQKITNAQILALAAKHFPDPKKSAAALSELINLARKKSPVTKAQLQNIIDSPAYNIEINSQQATARQLEAQCKHINASLFLMKAQVFYDAVSLIDNNNAQQEYYLTDIVKHLNNLKDTSGRPKYRSAAATIRNPDLIQSFNSPDELLTIQDHIRRRKTSKHRAPVDQAPKLKPTQYSTVRQWIEKIQSEKPSFTRWLKKIYGNHTALHQDRTKAILKVLRCYGKKFSFDDRVCIVRAPGRVNLMGRHVDHRGGFANFLAIDRETIVVAGPRSDSNVIAVNTNAAEFQKVQFNVNEIIGRFAWSDWINFVNSDWVRNLLLNSPGNWGNYIKAALVKLQHQYQDIKVNGINFAVTGNVPIAAGLSSSSTLVVAALQAAIALNNFEINSQQFIDLCGQGEWFVGSRGGAGDHAAIRLGQRGKIAHVGYFPFRVEDIVEAPSDYAVTIANSHVKAAKSSSAKDMFNTKIASYNLGLALLKQRCPEIKDAVQYLRDLNPQRLSCPTSDIYRMLLKIPQSATRKDILNMLSTDHKELIESSFATHRDPGSYSLRGVVLFGIAEIARSRICIDYLRAGKITELGRMMKISHDGDRVSSPDPSGKYKILQDPYTDQYLNKLIRDIRSEDPARVVNAQLYSQPGYYACSTVEIDQMVDIVNAIPEVAGAQIAGAGLGGCVMILVQKSAQQTVRQALTKNYYNPNKLTPAILDCITVQGAGLAQF
ncbi:MAG: NTP transferase domain-containing protein [Sedimentisphaerales bacterium]|nr:NTP transferase domain-containing protein [Sedimentisphaerales bacterium]